MTRPADKAAREVKAAQLRQRIAGLTGNSAGNADGAAEPAPPGAATPAAPPVPAPSNPRDFIAQRMRELAARKK